MIKEKLIDWSLYECYKDGLIYSKHYKRFLTGHIKNDGYVEVMLKCVNDKYRMFQWHRVVYTYFNGTIPEDYQINHINENKTDNRLCNLELVTPKQNCNHATRNERIAAKQRGISKPYVAEFKSRPVVAIKDGVVVMEFASTREAGRNGFSQGNVCECCNGKRRAHKGYRWFYKEDWLEIQKEKAKPVKRELPYQLSLQFD